MNVMHPEVCPKCGTQLVPHLNDIKAPYDEMEIKRLISENEALSKVTEGVYKKDSCPHYYNLLKRGISADTVIICFEDAAAWLHLYEKVLYKYELSAIAAHCIGVMAK